MFADDDITYPERTLQYMLAPFEDEIFGAVGTCQRTKRSETGSIRMKIVDWIFADYIERRNFETQQLWLLTGRFSCLSGRLMAIRAEIVQGVHFLNRFTSETWNGP